MALADTVFSYEFPQRLPIAVIGAGRHSARHIIPCLPYLPVDVIALAEPDREQAIQVARQIGARRVYTDYQALLEREEGVRAAVISAPGDAAALYPDPQIASAVLESRVHAWIDAPGASSVSDVTKEYTNGALKGRSYLMVGYRHPFMPGYEALKKTLVQRELSPRSYNLWTVIADRDGLSETDLVSRLGYPFALMTDLFGQAKSILWNWHPQRQGLSALVCYATGLVGTLEAHFASRTQPCRASLRVQTDRETFLVEDGRSLTHQADRTALSTVLGAEPPAAMTDFELESRVSVSDARQGLAASGYLGSLTHFCTALLAGQRIARMNIMDLLHLITLQESLAKREERQWLSL